jgi:hypothetical protein
MEWWDPRFPGDPDEILSQCICAQCPTYDNCGEGAAYCIRVDTSQLIDNEIHCLCPQCPVYMQLGLQHSYYCTRGSHFTRTMGPLD